MTMARKIANKVNRPRNLWWITGGVVGIFALCFGAAAVVRFFNPSQPTPLPLVPTYAYASPSPTTFAAGTSTATRPVTPTTPTLFSTSTLLPTPTNSSIFSWIFPYFYQGSQPTAIPFKSPTPLQAVVVSLTPTVTASAFPPPPTQGTPNPIVCKNILYPARPGNEWVYYVNTPKRSGDVYMKVITVEGTQATIDATELAVGTTVRSYMQCDQDIILSFPLLGMQKLIGEVVNGNMNVDYLGGVLAPNQTAFTSSNWALSWISQYRVYGDGAATFRGRDFQFTLSPSVINMTCQTLASGDASFENITVGAGTFRALKIICRGDGQATATVNGSQVTGSVTAQATQWFAPNIGMLRSQSDYVLLNVIGISIPLSPSEIAGYMELRSYNVGP